ncbi:MAG: glycoside hydrolase, partial [Muribaculaceae bacterium]|nr:glycoside hydrolase [Muribaculaceae bacterium]
MKKLKLLLIMLLCGVSASADIWTDEYRQVEQSIEQPSFADRTFNITRYGAKPGADAKKNQKAINKAIAACTKAGGGKVVIPAGTFETGAITLLDNVNLVVEEGATLLFAFRPELYPVVPTRWEGLDCWNLSPCIYAKDARNVAITGKGTIDG